MGGGTGEGEVEERRKKKSQRTEEECKIRGYRKSRWAERSNWEMLSEKLRQSSSYDNWDQNFHR